MNPENGFPRILCCIFAPKKSHKVALICDVQTAVLRADIYTSERRRNATPRPLDRRHVPGRLCGFPPFYAEEEEELLEKVRDGSFEFTEPYWNSISVQGGPSFAC